MKFARRYIVALAVIVSFAVSVAFLIRAQNPGADAMTRKLADAIAPWGFSIGTVESVEIKRGTATFRNIELDQDGFSTAGVIHMPVNMKRERRIDIEDIVLTGEMLEGFPAIGGWTPVPPPFPHMLDHARIKNAALDIMGSDSGILRLSMDAHMSREENGPGRRIDLATKADQQQLGMDGAWVIDWQPDGAWILDGTFNNAWAKLGAVDIARLSGWLNIISAKHANATLPKIAGQAFAGRMQLGDLPLANTSITIEGPLNQWLFILQSESAAHDKLLFSAELKRGSNGVTTDIAIESDNLDDLLDFLKRLHGGLENSRPVAGALMGLLITEGNMNRIRKELSGLSYTRIVLEIEGTLYDMNGKIVATDENDPLAARHIVSLNPGIDRARP